MNILSYNINESGSSIKRNCFSQLIRRESFDVCMIQEIKVRSLKEEFVGSLLGGKDVEWTSKRVIGKSGELIIMWKKGMFGLNFSFFGKCFVGINIICNGLNTYFVNIYSSCVLQYIRKCWKN